MAKEKKPKFDNWICNDCQYYWIGAGNTPRCHKGGKRIYYGECIEFKEKEKAPSEQKRRAREYEQYQREWN